MKHHKYYNTIWSERDQEFYWDGLKDGSIIGSVLTCVAILGIYEIVYCVKSFKDETKVR